jgi:hypothetical protein
LQSLKKWALSFVVLFLPFCCSHDKLEKLLPGAFVFLIYKDKSGFMGVSHGKKQKKGAHLHRIRFSSFDRHRGCILFSIQRTWIPNDGSLQISI